MAAESGTDHARTHETLTEAARAMRTIESTLRNAVSSHRVSNPLSFNCLDAFIVAATQTHKAVPASSLFLGSLDGEMKVSARLRRGPDTQHSSGKKRTRDDCAERARATCTKIHNIVSVSEEPERNKAQVTLAQDTVEKLLRNVKGPGGEEVFESCGVSLANVQAWTASASAPAQPAVGTPAHRPRMIIACRLAAGVALPLSAMKEALGECFRDGMITTRPESLGPDYQLPLTEHGQAVECRGQRSMLLFAAVPAPAVTRPQE